MEKILKSFEDCLNKENPFAIKDAEGMEEFHKRYAENYLNRIKAVSNHALHGKLVESLDVLARVKLDDMEEIVSNYNESFGKGHVLVCLQEGCLAPEDGALYGYKFGTEFFLFHEALDMFSSKEISVITAHEGMEQLMIRRNSMETYENNHNHNAALLFDRKVSMELFNMPYMREEMLEQIHKKYQKTDWFRHDPRFRREFKVRDGKLVFKGEELRDYFVSVKKP
ncbi:MAG: hypothetical protein ABIB71_00245 [Candidatus Woesearchaeota archaeon]